MQWNDFRTAERIGQLLQAHLPTVGRIEVHRTAPVVSGTGFAIVIEERFPPADATCAIKMGDDLWTVPIDGAWDQHVEAVVGQLVSRIVDIRADISHQTISEGDRFRAIRSQWGIRRGRTFAVVRQISHLGHDPVVTYELSGHRVPRLIEVSYGDPGFNRVWERM